MTAPERQGAGATHALPYRGRWVAYELGAAADMSYGQSLGHVRNGLSPRPLTPDQKTALQLLLRRAFCGSRLASVRSLLYPGCSMRAPTKSRLILRFFVSRVLTR